MNEDWPTPEERIENAQMAASETQPSWKHRCYAIMGALGLDYGDPDWEMPDDRKRSEELIERLVKALECAEEEFNRISCLPTVTETRGTYEQLELAKKFADRGAVNVHSALAAKEQQP